MLFYFETANKYAVWKENWVEFCNISVKIKLTVKRGGLNLAVFRQFRHIYNRHYFKKIVPSIGRKGNFWWGWKFFWEVAGTSGRLGSTPTTPPENPPLVKTLLLKLLPNTFIIIKLYLVIRSNEWGISYYPPGTRIVYFAC